MKCMLAWIINIDVYYINMELTNQKRRTRSYKASHICRGKADRVRKVVKLMTLFFFSMDLVDLKDYVHKI